MEKWKKYMFKLCMFAHALKLMHKISFYVLFCLLSWDHNILFKSNIKLYLKSKIILNDLTFFVQCSENMNMSKSVVVVCYFLMTYIHKVVSYLNLCAQWSQNSSRVRLPRHFSPETKQTETEMEIRRFSVYCIEKQQKQCAS